jgi:hypothetical protein
MNIFNDIYNISKKGIWSNIKYFGYIDYGLLGYINNDYLTLQIDKYKYELLNFTYCDIINNDFYIFYKNKILILIFKYIILGIIDSNNINNNIYCIYNFINLHPNIIETIINDYKHYFINKIIKSYIKKYISNNNTFTHLNFKL